MNINPDLLRSYVAVAEMQSFTLAARRLGLQQSTVSQHVKRLEDIVQRRLLARDTHSVSPTIDGVALMVSARQVLDANRRLQALFAKSGLHGHLRLGISEDFVQSGLADVLAAFTQRHPRVDLALTVGLSGHLYEAFDMGGLDVLLAKRRRGDRRGHVVWREQLVWVGRPGIRPDPHQPLSLVLYPPPSITRAIALDALTAAKRPWRVACTSSSLSGVYAATRAGLGLAPHSGVLIPPGLAVVASSGQLPELSEVEFVAIGPERADELAQAVIEAILHSSYAKDATAAM